MDLATLIKILNLAALVALMLSMGLKTRFEDVLASARRTTLIVWALLANFVLVPLAAIALLFVFKAPPLVSVGFLILAVCPGAPVGPPFAALAKGDVPCAIGLMVILASLSALLSPLLLASLVGRLAPTTDLHIDPLSIIQTLVVFQVLPVAVGLACHRWSPRLTGLSAKPIGLLANLLLLSVLALILVTQYPTLSALRLRAWGGMLLLLVASLGIGWLVGGPDRATRKTLSVTTAARNAAVGLVLVSTGFAGTPAVTAVVAYALVSVLGALGCAMLFSRSMSSGVVDAPPPDHRRVQSASVQPR